MQFATNKYCDNGSVLLCHNKYGVFNLWDKNIWGPQHLLVGLHVLVKVVSKYN